VRTTLNIDEPVLHALKERARCEGRSAGAIASDLIRRGLSQPLDAGVQEALGRYGFRPFAAVPEDHLVTNGQVDRLRDELSI
jgi:plasmid stability protein